MASIVAIETLGNSLAVVLDDGNRYVAKPTGHGIWKLPPINAGENESGNDGGGTSIPPTGDLPAAPDSFNAAGRVFNKVNMNHARDILLACRKISAANNQKVMRIVLITAIIESAGLWMYSNIRHYPETANIPHDRDGSDHDSVGLFQQRPVAGWGTPTECMTTDYSVRAFLGGPGGPNGGSPRGLFDVPGWEAMTPGQAAQKVQVSAFPDRYDQVIPQADAIIGFYIK